MKPASHHLRLGGLGVVLGFTLSSIGFSDYDQLHHMFTFTDLRMMFTFMGAVGLAAIPLALIARKRALPAAALHKGVLPGGILFGIGWALSGACPAIPLVQLGEGKLTALVVIVGLVAGIALYPSVHGRWFRWDTKGCSD